MNWNDAAEDLLHQILQQTPRPVREATEAKLRETAERRAGDDGLNRVGVHTVIAAFIEITPEALRPELGHQLGLLGLDSTDYEHLL